jgi:hypothetical protein
MIGVAAELELADFIGCCKRKELTGLYAAYAVFLAR